MADSDRATSFYYVFRCRIWSLRRVAYGGTILTILAAFQTFLGTIFKTGEYRYDKDKAEARKDDIEW